MKKFYRVANITTGQGLWYDFTGSFTGYIHTAFNFCQNNELKMDFDEELVGWLSATPDLESLYSWFPVEDIVELQKHGWFIHVYETNEKMCGKRRTKPEPSGQTDSKCNAYVSMMSYKKRRAGETTTGS